MYGNIELLKSNVKNQNRKHLACHQNFENDLQVQNHAMFSSVKGSEGHSLMSYTALLSIIGKTTVQDFTHSTTTRNKANT